MTCIICTARGIAWHNPDGTRSAHQDMNRLNDLAIFTGGPIYKEVKRRVTDALAGGEWKPGEAIPSEARLAERFGVSIGTVRRAIDELVAENVLLRQQGRGTFVATHGRDRMRFLFFNIVRQDGVKSYPETRLERFRRGRADPGAAARLLLAPRAPVFEFRNVQWIDDAPVVVDDIVVPEAMFPGLTQRRLQQHTNTVYHLYEHEFGVSVVRTAETLRAVAAEDDVAQALQLAAGAPVLQILRVAFTLHERPVEWRVSYVNTAAHEYHRDTMR